MEMVDMLVGRALDRLGGAYIGKDRFSKWVS